MGWDGGTQSPPTGTGVQASWLPEAAVGSALRTRDARWGRVEAVGCVIAQANTCRMSGSDLNGEMEPVPNVFGVPLNVSLGVGMHKHTSRSKLIASSPSITQELCQQSSGGSEPQVVIDILSKIDGNSSKVGTTSAWPVSRTN